MIVHVVAYGDESLPSNHARHRTRLRDEGQLEKGQVPGDEDFEVDVYTVADTLKVTTLVRSRFSRTYLNTRT